VSPSTPQRVNKTFYLYLQYLEFREWNLEIILNFLTKFKILFDTYLTYAKIPIKTE
jgi:hypothetical protein